jgi:signal transduction histidine kinase
MYRRLVILSAIIVLAMCGMSWLGYHAVTKWEEGLKGSRIGHFAHGAEQIRSDVKRKLDEFMKQERNRPYTDYQYYYVPENIAPNQQTTVLTSPLRFKMSNGLAYGYFQIEPGGQISTPYYSNGDQGNYRVGDEQVAMAKEAAEYQDMLRKKLLPLVKLSSRQLSVPVAAQIQPLEEKKHPESLPKAIVYDKTSEVTGDRLSPSSKQKLKVESLLPSGTTKPQVVVQNRAYVQENAYSNSVQTLQPQADAVQAGVVASQAVGSQTQGGARTLQEQRPNTPAPVQQGNELVNITIESFVPVVISVDDSNSIFHGQIYMLRHVKIEDRDIIQGFRFDEKRLLEEVQDSAKIIPSDMSFVTSQTAAGDGAYAAVLSFGRGELPFWIKDKDPEMISHQIANLRNWYFGIITFVFMAVMLGLASVWRNVHAQVSLARKKDDFISAVSHELRTPLTSIRMHSEMLENKWVKSEEKAGEYYRSMRQESERLSRLIENVLDFSRIQRGRKKYNFAVGDINQCIAGVIEMMKPYAAQSGFAIEADLGTLSPTKFDRDAITQIVVNLLDNAIKYARETDEKTIYIRTRKEGQYTIIEVEDRGPGLPHRERKKVFEQFYRVASESTREVPGTGLGLAIVKKFVEAHNGFVEILSAKPKGAVFRVGLPASS